MFTFKTTCPICGSENKNPYSGDITIGGRVQHPKQSIVAPIVSAKYYCKSCRCGYTVSCSDDDYVFKNIQFQNATDNNVGGKRSDEDDE